jgi:hypothetical protein
MNTSTAFVFNGKRQASHRNVSTVTLFLVKLKRGYTTYLTLGGIEISIPVTVFLKYRGIPLKFFKEMCDLQ